jgi:hypothetical protein
MKPVSKIVFDGPERYREAGNYVAVRRRILDEVTQRYREETTRAGFWGRLWIEAKIRREVRAELKKLFPSAALHVSHAVK